MLKSIFLEDSISDETVWHKRKRAPLFSRTMDGQRLEMHGQIWRRKRNGKWEYQQDAETADEFSARAPW